MQKQCKLCRKSFELNSENFHIDSHKKDGFQSCCKECQNLKKRLGRKINKSDHSSLIPEGYKKCSICKEVKSINEYHSNKSTNDGLAYDCKKCKLTYSKKYSSRDKLCPDSKDCSDCGLHLDIRNFTKEKASKDGYGIRCKPCERKRINEHAKENRVIIEEKQCSKCKQTLPVNLFKVKSESIDGYSSSCKFCIRGNVPVHLKWARSSAGNHTTDRQTVEFSREALAEVARNTPKCQFCGIELLYDNKTGHHQWDSPSLENLNLNDHLTLENIAIVCRKCNTSKLNRTLSDYIEYLETILPNLKKLKEERNLPEEESLPIIPSFEEL